MLKVLILEDDPNVVGFLREILAEEGMLSVHASDLSAGWASLISENPDAAIVDLWLGGYESGWDLLNQIRKNEHFSDLPVVIVTGSSGANVAERAHVLGAEFLTKPFTPPALVDRLRRAMQAAGRTPGVRSLSVVILTPTFRVEGYIHVPGELPRFSDAWEALVGDPRGYVPLTKARVQSLDGTTDVAENALLEVRKSDITAVFPLDGE